MFEELVQKSMQSSFNEKTFVDKLLAKEDVNAIRDLIKKPRLTREDLLEILYLLSSSEAKLLNYGAWDRYVQLKFFVWIREFVKVAELLYDYKDFLEKKQNEDPAFKLGERTKKYLDNNERIIEHNAKFLIDLYFNIGRTSLSLGGTGFYELLTNKFEMNYPNQQIQPQVEGSKIPVIGRFLGK